MGKISLLEEFVEFVKERRKSGKCGGENHEGGGDSGEEHKHEELTEEEVQKLKTTFEKIIAKEGSGFLIMKTGEENRFLALSINRLEIVATLVSALGNVISEMENKKMRRALIDGAGSALKHFYGDVE